MIHAPVTVVNVLQKSPIEISNFLNTHVLNTYLPSFTPNHQVDIKTDLIPVLAKSANDRAYVGQLYNIVVSAYYQQKINKKNKTDYDGDVHLELEAKKEILHRSVYSLDRTYEAASRLMTGTGFPDPRMNRY